MRGTWLYSFECIKAVAEIGVNNSSHPLWMDLYLKQENSMLNIKNKNKKNLAIILVNQQIVLPEQAMKVLSLEIFLSCFYKYLSRMDYEEWIQPWILRDGLADLLTSLQSHCL